MTQISDTNGIRVQLNLDNYCEMIARSEPPMRFAFSTRGDRSVAEWQEAFRSELALLLGFDEIARRRGASPRCILRERVEEADHVREDWLIETEQDFLLPAYVLRPLKDSEGPARRPVVITPQGHGVNGRQVYCGVPQTPEDAAEIRDGERDIALQAVRAGYIAIAHEGRGYGDSRGPKALAMELRTACDQWQHRAQLFGRTQLGERIWDIQRLIDWAATQDDADATRVAVTGNSGGGTASLFAAAMETRITVCVPGSSFCTFADSICAMRHCGCNYVPGILKLGEMPDVAGLIAPRPLLIVHGKEDRIFPIDATRNAFAQVQDIYAACEASGRCELYVGDGGHRYYATPVWPFMKRWL